MGKESDLRIILPSVPFGNVYWYVHFFIDNEIVIDPFEHYIKQSCRNRYEILNHQGRQALTIPVAGQKGRKLPVKDIEIADDWQSHHWKNLFSSYNSSPYFIYYKDGVEELLSSDFSNIHDFNLASLELISNELQLDLKFSISENYCESGVDRRNMFKPCSGKFQNSKYHQVFEDRLDFVPNLSILDLMFNLGPETETYLRREAEKLK